VSLLAEVDGLAPGPVVVFGTPPPVGRDLDLLVRPAERPELEAGLARVGFSRDGARFVRFRACSVDVVEVVPAADWKLPAAELEALFEQGAALGQAVNLRRPAPHHELLILARKVAWGGLEREAKQRVRLDAALADDPDAFLHARGAAAAWGAEPALDLLERAWRSGLVPGRRERTTAVAAILGARGERPASAWLRAGRWLARRPRRGRLITLSGLDGAGKSSQAEALRDTLDRLGHEAVVRWTSLSQHPPVLHWLTGIVGRLAGRGGSDGSTEADPGEAGKALRERSSAVTFAWSTIVALTNARSQSRGTRRDVWRGRIVICDRYTLDSKVHLRYAYGEGRAFRFQSLLIRLLSPRPDRAFLLDVSPEEATRRKPDYPLAENARRAALYRNEYARLGVRRLDGELPQEELCTLLAAEVLEMLRH
jgi:thymidylate kinase